MENRPHIIRIVAHDVGQHIGCYGIDTVETPHLDRLAAEGIRFENSFCAAPQCSPSRASMVTGRYPHNNGVMGLSQTGFSWKLNDDEKHLAELLSEEGWQSVLSGHHHGGADDDVFDEIVRHTTETEEILEGAKVAIRDHAGSDAPPLYLQVEFFEPHRQTANPSGFPNPTIPDKYNDEVTLPGYLLDEPSGRDELRAFEAAVERLDWSIGQVLKTIDDAGMASNSLVIATTDHGIPFPRAKCSPYDPGLETFLLARWPDRLPAAATYESPISTVDHLPTLFDLLDIEVSGAVQGISHAPEITAIPNSGDRPQAPRETVFAELTHHIYTDPRRAVRTREYKCIVNFTNAPFFMDPSQQHRPGTTTRHPRSPMNTYHPPVELYDLRADPLETENLTQSSQHEDARRELLCRLYDWMLETNDPILEGIPTPPIYDAAIESLKTGSVVEPDP